jgi:DNA-directed RNA polymerase specialized sigma24 family protein
MLFSALIAPQLPYLRRFARVLTGSQASGDAYAGASIAALAEERQMLDDEASARMALFKAFLSIWSSVLINQQRSDEQNSSDQVAADRTLEALTPGPRVAFLLRALEGFRVDEIATLLDRSVAEVDSLLAHASREIAAQLSTDVLIIEDEQLIAMDLESLVMDLGHRVTSIARSRDEAVRSIATDPPGLVLADIRLADGSSGLDAVNDIISDQPVPVIFITGFPERLLTGERPEPAFLITKPFSPDTVMAVISQALFFDRRATARGFPMLPENTSV